MDLLMVATLALTVLALVLFATEWLSVELTALSLLCALLLLAHFVPKPGLDPEQLLAGFANPALITVLALLVVGEGLVQTGALDKVAVLVRRLRLPGAASIALALVFVAAISAVLNNTPVVVIFMPILQSLALSMGIRPGRVLMGLSFAAILGGMTTLIGSSTNLLVSSSLIALGQQPLGFFEFLGFGTLLAGVGLVWTVLVVPRLLRDRGPAPTAGDGRQFVSHATVPAGSPLLGEVAVAGMFRSLPDMTVRLIRRGDEAVFPPFDGLRLQAGDVLILASTRRALTLAAARHAGLLHPPSHDEMTRGDTDQVVAEAMVRPAARMIGQTIRQFGFMRRFNCTVLGIQRHARMTREPMTDIRLEAGDVLLIQGRPADIEALRAERDVVVMSGTAGEIPRLHHARRALVVFALAVGLAALDIVPIVITALVAAAGLIAMGALNVRQALRALDHQVALMVGASLALGKALEVSGGAAFVADAVVAAVGGAGPQVMLSAYFLLVALVTNVLSNNACAVLFTPIAVGLAQRLGVDPHIFAIATVLAANCSFATPIGYQTNLLVMGPGHYKFADFVRAGLPLVGILWLVFTLAAPWVWGL